MVKWQMCVKEHVLNTKLLDTKGDTDMMTDKNDVLYVKNFYSMKALDVLVVV